MRYDMSMRTPPDLGKRVHWIPPAYPGDGYKMATPTEDEMSETAELDLAALRALAGNSTPGPWRPVEERDGWRAGRETVVWATPKRVVTVDQTRPHHDAEAEANVRFICAARQALPALCDEVDRLRAEVAKTDSALAWTQE